MARTKEERDALRAELDREDAEETERSRGGGRAEHIEVMIDLSDESAVKRGISLGFLKPSDIDGGDGDGDGDGDNDGDDDDDEKKKRSRSPQRRGYFDDKK